MDALVIETAAKVLPPAVFAALAGRLYCLYRKTRGEDAMPGLGGALFCLWLLSLPVLHGYFFTVKLPGLFDLTVERTLFMLVAAATVVRIHRQGFPHRPTTVAEIASAVFLGLALFSMTQTGFFALEAEGVKPLYLFLFGYVIPFFVYEYARRFLVPGRDFLWVFTALHILGMYLCGTAFLEHFGFKALIFPRFITDESILLHLDRARGPTLNAAFNGTIMVVCLLAGVYLLGKIRGGARALHACSLALYPPAVFFTNTRSAYLALVFALAALYVFYPFKRLRLRLAPLILTGLIVLAAFIGDRLLSADRDRGGVLQVEEVEIRFELIAKSLALIAENPFLGAGLGRFITIGGEGAVNDQQHNHIIGLAAELGLPGVLVYLVFLGAVFRSLLALAARSAPRSEAAKLGLLLGIMVTVNLINNTFVEPTYTAFMNVSVFLAAGMIENLLDRAKADLGESTGV